MALTEQQLAIVLQASIDKARELLAHDGAFMPFGVRAKPDGAVEFVQLALNDGDPIEALYDGLGQLLGLEAREGEIAGSAIVGLARSGERTAIRVVLEAPGFCRAIVVPYRFASDALELDRMMSEPADPIVYAAV